MQSGGDEGGNGFKPGGLSEFRAAESTRRVFGGGPPTMLTGAGDPGPQAFMTPKLQHVPPPTYRGASSRAWSWCPPAHGRRGPRTSSNQCCHGTGWAHSARAHRTRGQTSPGAEGAGPPPPLSRGCVPVAAGSGSSLLLSGRQAKGTRQRWCHRGSSPHTQLRTAELPGHHGVAFY